MARVLERSVVGKFHASERLRNAVRYIIHVPLPSVRLRVIHEFVLESDFALFIFENKR
jgi:hypothetical protein